MSRRVYWIHIAPFLFNLGYGSLPSPVAYSLIGPFSLHTFTPSCACIILSLLLITHYGWPIDSGYILQSIPFSESVVTMREIPAAHRSFITGRSPGQRNEEFSKRIGSPLQGELAVVIVHSQTQKVARVCRFLCFQRRGNGSFRPWDTSNAYRPIATRQLRTQCEVQSEGGVRSGKVDKLRPWPFTRVQRQGAIGGGCFCYLVWSCLSKKP